LEFGVRAQVLGLVVKGLGKCDRGRAGWGTRFLFWVWGLGVEGRGFRSLDDFRVQGLGLGIWGLGLGFGVGDLGFGSGVPRRLSCRGRFRSGFWVWGLGFPLLLTLTEVPLLL